MTNIILHGCNGAMGKCVADAAACMEGFNIAAGIDLCVKDNQYGFYVASSFDDKELNKIINEKKCVVIDFSNAKAVNGLLDFCVDNNIPLVLCTTGLDAEVEEKIKNSSDKIAVLRSSNMSVGVNALMKLVSEAAKILFERGFDIEIVEKHHNRKKDAPSGTALMLADSICNGCNEKLNYIYDRSSLDEKRNKNDLGISSVRGGGIIGEHEVIYASEDETISISHTAYSKKIFANGALRAAEFIDGKKSGIYDMKDVLSL